MVIKTSAYKDIDALNRNSCCFLDRAAIARNLDDPGLLQMLFEDRPHLFAEVAVFISKAVEYKLNLIIAAVEKVIALPDYQECVLAYAPSTAKFLPKSHGVFIGYDFHLRGEEPSLIEINSNAGGGLLNAILLRSQRSCCDLAGKSGNGKHAGDDLEQVFMAMFLEEWFLERDTQALCTCAIVDENPQTQFMYPEFLLFKKLFEKNNIKTVICDPSELEYQEGILSYKNTPIDLVYNRLTDFGLTSPVASPLCSAYLENAVVVTPHPRTCALYANKRNLSILGDDKFLLDLGLDQDTRKTLTTGIAQTSCVKAIDAEKLWVERKNLFFKPLQSYGGKGVYRGDKMTRRVFNEILKGSYVAQTMVQPSVRELEKNSVHESFKLDIRSYVYSGKTQLTSARLYQGQTTNFRTTGGGFARVVIV
jgi:hypothetical protein